MSYRVKNLQARVEMYAQVMVPEDRALIASALRVAATQYAHDARSNSGTRSGDDFQRLADDCRVVAETVEL